MEDQKSRKAAEALEALEQAYSYYTPEKRPECESPAYDERPLGQLPLAA
ncbi:MAG: hypothetical protein N4A70_11585 [Pelagimonas sp.]|jgi:hypothetical protein|nr:hypothetical protein [Pelagimonas sp.]